MRCFLIGHPVGHSLSPVMFRAGFDACGLDWEYRAVDVPPGEVARGLRELTEQGAVGINVTMPHKGQVLAHAASLTSRAARVGAANVLTRLGEQWEADNTDWLGVVRALQDVGFRVPAPVDGAVAVLFGAGGAARAVAFALAELGLRLVVVNRDTARGGSLCAEVPGARYLPWGHPDIGGVVARASIVINATPLGMGDLRALSPLSPGQSPGAGAVACDLVYHPVHTTFLRQAERAGAICITGLEVLLGQAIPAFETWTGRPAPVAAMRAALYGAAQAR